MATNDNEKTDAQDAFTVDKHTSLKILKSFKKVGEASMQDQSDRMFVPSMSHMFYDTIDGVNYYTLNANGRIKQQLPIIRDLDLRSDDIITCGFPKSGNHWIFEVISMILQQSTEFNKRMFHTNMIEFLNPDVQNVLNAIESPRNLHTHLRVHRLPSQVLQKKLKIVYIVRNPKDVAYSMYYMFNSNRGEFMRYNESFREYFDLFLKGEAFWGHWFDHIWSYESFTNENPDYPLFILSFEKMKLQPVEVIKELCAFLGKPNFLAEDIAKVTKFDNIKSVLSNGKMKFVGEVACLPGRNFIFRKGEIGDWKNWLDADQSEMFDKLFEERMAGSKLAELVKEYI